MWHAVYLENFIHSSLFILQTYKSCVILSFLKFRFPLLMWIYWNNFLFVMSKVLVVSRAISYWHLSIIEWSTSFQFWHGEKSVLFFLLADVKATNQKTAFLHWMYLQISCVTFGILAVVTVKILPSGVWCSVVWQIFRVLTSSMCLLHAGNNLTDQTALHPRRL
jgi:hypothetical protein